MKVRQLMKSQKLCLASAMLVASFLTNVAMVSHASALPLSWVVDDLIVDLDGNQSPERIVLSQQSVGGHSTIAITSANERWQLLLPWLDASHIITSVATVADFDRDGWQDLLVQATSPKSDEIDRCVVSSKSGRPVTIPTSDTNDIELANLYNISNSVSLATIGRPIAPLRSGDSSLFIRSITSPLDIPLGDSSSDNLRNNSGNDGNGRDPNRPNPPDGPGPGDVRSARILPSGWQAAIVLDQMPVGGTFNFGNENDGWTITFDVTSQGYDEFGNLGTIERTVNATCVVMQPWPNNTLHQINELTDGIEVIVALSEFVYDDDTDGGPTTSGVAPKVTVLPEWYTITDKMGNTTTSRGTTHLRVNNESVRDYPKVIARWAVVPHQRFTDIFTLECIAFQRFGRDGRPVAAVEFKAFDGTTKQIDSFVTGMTKSNRDDLPVYQYEIFAADYQQGSVVNCDFVAYPWVGDENSVRATSSDPSPSLELVTLPLLADAADTFGVTVAFIDTRSDIAVDTFKGGPFTKGEVITQAKSGATAIMVADATESPLVVAEVTGKPSETEAWVGQTSGTAAIPLGLPIARGDNSTGIAADTANEAVARAQPFATWGPAAVAIQSFNVQTHGRTNPDAGIIYLEPGLHRAGDRQTPYTGPQNVWLTVQPAPDVLPEDCPIIGPGERSDQLRAQLIRLHNLKVISSENNQTILRGRSNEALWVDGVDFQGYDATVNRAAFDKFPIAFFTDVNMTGYANGLGQFGNNVLSPLHRNCHLVGVESNAFRGSRAVLQCTAIDDRTVGSGASFWDVISPSENLILYNCRAINWRDNLADVSVDVDGLAIVNVLAERVGTQPFPLLAMESENDYLNILLWHVSLAGNRTNLHNDALPNNEFEFSIKYCSWNYFATKHDVFANEGELTGGWPVYYSVGSVGNNSEDLPDLFPPIVRGPLSTGSQTAGYVNDLSIKTTDEGFGDYHPTLTSTLLNRIPVGQRVVPYDLEGTPVLDNGAAGALQPNQD